MSLDAASIASFAYTQGQVYFVDQDTLCTATGNGLVAYSLGKLDQQRHVWGDDSRNGASLGSFVLGCAPTGGIVAYAAQDYPGDVTVARGPSLTPMKKLKVGAELGYKELAVSRCRAHVAVVAGLPDFQLTIWDWLEEKQVAAYSAGQAFTGCGLSFFPATSSVAVTLGERKAVVIRFDLTTSSPSVQHAEIDLSILSNDERITSHAWTEARELYIGTSHGRILRVPEAAPDPSPAPRWGQGRGPPLVAAPISLPKTAALGKKVRVAGIVATKRHIIVANAQEGGTGVVIWYNRHVSAISDSDTMAISHVCQLDEPGLCWLAVDPEFRNLVVGSISGSLAVLQVDVNATDSLKLSTTVLKVGQFFGGPVTGVSALPHSMSAAAAEDGTVQLWKHSEVDGDVYSQLVATWNLVEAATSCHSCYESPVIAVGTEGGVVQLLDAEAAAHIEPGEEAAAGTPAAEQTIGTGRPGQPDPSAQAVIFSSRLHNCPVVSVAVSPAGDRVASLAKDGSVAVLQRDRDDTTCFQVSCLTEVVEASGSIAWVPALPNRPLAQRLALAIGSGEIHLITPPVVRSEQPDAREGLSHPAAKLGLQVVRTQSRILALHAAPADGATGDVWLYAASADRSLRRFRVTAASAEQRRATNSYLLPEVDKPRELAAAPTCLSLSADFKTLVVTTASGSLLIYSLPMLDPVGNWALANPARGGATSCAMQITEDGSLLALTGGGDGVLHVLELSERQVKQHQRSLFGGKHGAEEEAPPVTGPGGGQPILGGFSSIVANAPFAELISCAAEASSFLEAYKTQQLQMAMDRSSSLHSGMRANIEKVRTDFRACIRQNEMADEDERLPRQEFVIDRELRNILLTEGNERIKKIQTELRMGMARERLLNERLQHMCAESVLEVYTRIHAIGTDGTFKPGSATAPPPPPTKSEVLDNFPLRKQPTEQQRRIACVRFLRKVEVLEWEKRPAKYRGHVAVVGYQMEGEGGGGGAVQSEESGEDVLHEEHSVAVSQAATAKSSAAAAAAINAPDDALVCEAHQAVGWGPDRLLYREMAVHTALRKRIQIMLLDQYIIVQKKEFNDKFKQLLHQKFDAMSKVEEQQARIVEILKELEVDETPFVVHLMPDEEPESLLKVKDEDVKVARYVSPEEQARLDKEAAKHAAAMDAANKDSGNARALQMMMHGTLEKKEDKKVTLKREAWMDMPLGEMSKEQRQALKDFERRQTELEEEFERHTRGLEAEKKTLEGDVDRIIHGFNERLSELCGQRLLLDMELNTAELLSARLASTMEEAEHSKKMSKRIEKEVAAYRMLLPQQQALVTELQRMVMRQRQSVDSLAAEDKLIDKAFRKDFHVAELEEHHDLFSKMFKDRRRELFSGGGEVKRGTDLLGQKSSRALHGASTRSRGPQIGPGIASRQSLAVSSATDAAASVVSGEEDLEATDPFKGVNAWEESSSEYQGTRPAFKAEDWPENVSPELFTRLMELRDAKVMTERELTSSSARLTRLLALVEAGQEDETATHAAIERLNQELVDLALEVDCYAINLNMKYTLKMGQMEIPDQAIVPDFADGCLMEKKKVELLNGEIISRSGDKIAKMREISSSRSELTLTDWENGSLDLGAEHKMQHISELQLLHVTREIQNFMADPERALAYNQEVQLQNQLVANDKAHRLKVALLRKRLGNYEEASEEQEMENGFLKENTAKASAALGERERMNDALGNADDTPAKQRARTFRNIVTNQKLLDISRSQMEELHFLANELHRLKQRSYPSFSVPFPPGPFDLRPGTTGHDVPGAGKYSRRPLSGMRDRPRTSASMPPTGGGPAGIIAVGSRPGSQQSARRLSAGQHRSSPPTPPLRGGSRRPPTSS